MSWKVVPCKACGEMIELILSDGKMRAFNFEGLGKRGDLHIKTCSNPDFFKKKDDDKKFQTKARQDFLKDPWWAK